MFWYCYVMKQFTYCYRLCDVNVMKLVHYKNSYNMKLIHCVMQHFLTFTNSMVLLRFEAT
jgi:hypothetical protein